MFSSIDWPELSKLIVSFLSGIFLTLFGQWLPKDKYVLRKEINNLLF